MTYACPVRANSLPPLSVFILPFVSIISLILFFIRCQFYVKSVPGPSSVSPTPQDWDPPFKLTTQLPLLSWDVSIGGLHQPDSIWSVTITLGP